MALKLIEGEPCVEFISVKYEPQENITAYELALLLPALTAGFVWSDEVNFNTRIYKAPLDWWSNLDPSMQRHLKRL
jgi:hypothetical protein